jgi:DnaJ-class molecular chaperone
MEVITMSWECYSNRKCTKCGNGYEVEESTLAMAMKNYDACPKCGGHGETISSKSMTDAINGTIEKLKIRKKRCIL